MTIFNIVKSTSIEINFSNAPSIINFIETKTPINNNQSYITKTTAIKINNSIAFTPNSTTLFQGITDVYNGFRNIIIFHNNEQFILICSSHTYNSSSKEDEFTITHVLNGTTGIIFNTINTEYITMYP